MGATVVAPRSEPVHPPSGGRSRHARRAAWAVAAAAAAGAAVLGWSAWSARSARDFPRREELFLKGAELERALQAAAERLEADPDDLKALVDTGILHFQRGREGYADAINALDDARNLGALDDRVFYYLGVMYQEEGLFPFAIREYQRFLRNRPEDEATRLLLAKVLFQQGRHEEALAHYRRSAGLRPKDPLVTENLALCLAALKRDKEAADAFEALAALGPVQARRAHYHLGRLAVERKDHAGALKHFEAVLPVDGEPPLGLPAAEVHATLAGSFEKLARWEEAKRHWEAVLAGEPKHARAKAGLKSAEDALRKAAREARRKAKRK